MRLSVLYSTDGRIVAVMRSPAADTLDASDVPSPVLTVRPAEGERMAFVDVDPAWDRRPLAELHQAFTVVDGADGPSLRPRETAN
jgi:hypothetical protein